MAILIVMSFGTNQVDGGTIRTLFENLKKLVLKAYITNLGMKSKDKKLSLPFFFRRTWKNLITSIMCLGVWTFKKT